MRTRYVALMVLGCGGPAKFADVQEKVFTPSCTFVTCHKGMPPGGDLNLEAGNSYAQLVGALATGPQGMRKRVIPGDVANSYLMEKLLSETPDGGVRMPQNGDPLEPDRMQLVKEWIANGALEK